MKILLTGATGFIGSHVARFLINQKCDVWATLRQQSKLWRIDDIAPSLQLLTTSLEDKTQLYSQLKRIKPEICLHLAWFVEPGLYLHDQRNLESFRNSLNLIQVLAGVGCQKLVATGTCFEYDTDSKQPLSETSPTKPCNLYAASKEALHLILEQYTKNVGMKFLWLRLFFQYGPYEDERRFIPYVITSLLKNQIAKTTLAKQARDYLYIDDVASAIGQAALSNLTGIVNIGSGQAVRIHDIAAKIAETLKKRDLLAIGAREENIWEPELINADNNKLKANTSWQPRYSLEEGLGRSIEWWKNRLALTTGR